MPKNCNWSIAAPGFGYKQSSEGIRNIASGFNPEPYTHLMHFFLDTVRRMCHNSFYEGPE